MRYYSLLTVIAACFAATTVLAETHDKNSILSSNRYLDCTQQSRHAPEAALEKAVRWYEENESLSAQHCIALSLYGMRNFAEAAQALEKTAHAISPEQTELKANLWLQAAKAWNMAKLPEKAQQRLSVAIASAMEHQQDGLLKQLLLERSQMIQEEGDMFRAVQDLDHILALEPSHQAALAARAKLMDALGQKDAAKQDYRELVRLNPNHTEANRYLHAPGEARVVPTAAVR